jgi:hypothetical protein
VWSHGDGKSIVIGKDRILGMGDAVLLSKELLVSINRKGIFFLYQAQKEAQVGRITLNWFSSTDLELTRQLQEEWSLFRRALILNGVFLQANPDILKWSGDNSTGLITVKNVYLAAATMKWNNNFGYWCMAMWKWNVPLKIKLFTWLLAENKILSWEILQHRGFSGLGICLLCKLNVETTQHLFLDCDFAVEVWR